MGNLQPLDAEPSRVIAPVERRPLDPDAVAAEHEQVEVELARAPALARAAPERPLEPLEREQEGERPGRGVRPGRHVQRQRRVAELGLVGDADRGGGIQTGHAPEASARQGAKGADGGAQGGRGIAQVRAQADIGTDTARRGDGRPTGAGASTVERDGGEHGAENTPVRRVLVLILHRPASGGDGPFARGLAAARARLAERHLAGFRAAGADEARMVAEADDTSPFGTRLARIVGGARPAPHGVVVLGSGALPLARPADRRRFVEAARGAPGMALANNRYSGDAVAVAGAEVLAGLPPLPGDNALPRWLEEVAGYAVRDLRRVTRLQLDLDTPLDLLLLAGLPGATNAIRATAATLPGPAPARLAAVLAVLADPRAELVVAGRTSAATLAALERAAACRVRALVEERGLRASSPLALGQARPPGTRGVLGTAVGALVGATVHPDEGPRAEPAVRPGRAPRSTLGLLLDRDGPGALGTLLAGLGEAAVVDTRVLLAHRLGVDEQGWPTAEDRFASDLLLPERVGDRWLRALTAAALEAPIPVLLGGHTLVGPALRLLARTSRAGHGDAGLGTGLDLGRPG